MKEGKHRVSRVVTRTGDKGESGLADGSRLPKQHPRFELMGALDELNSSIGYLVSLGVDDTCRPLIEKVQQTLFDVGSEAAAPNASYLTEADVEELDADCASLNAGLPPLTEFVLPGGAPAGAYAHICRTLVRTAERRLSALGETDFVNPASRAWLNRLSDFFFILSRHLNLSAGAKEPQWRGPRKPS